MEKKKALQWHLGFQAAVQIELIEDQEYLQFIKEYPLTEKSLEMDLLIIKRHPGYQVQKSIGKIFRQYNVVEYKGPKDYISVNDFFKVLGYACVFQSNTEKVRQRPPKEITITFVTNRYPFKLMHLLQDTYQTKVENTAPGIYQLKGLMFPMQLILAPELTKEEYVWLSRLREDLNNDDAEHLSKAYIGKNKNPLYAAAMDLIVKANKDVYEEARDMCEAIRELFADEFEQKERELTERLTKQVTEQVTQKVTQQVTQHGALVLIENCMEFGVGKAETLAKVIEKFSLDKATALSYVEQVWNNA